MTSTRIAGSSSADYWTPDRMRAAIPGDVLAKKALQRQETNAVHAEEAAGKGAETKIKASEPAVQPMANASENRYLTSARCSSP